VNASSAPTPFVASLRARPGTLRLAAEGAPVITIRVQVADAWDMVRIVVNPSESVATVKESALEEIDGSGDVPGQFFVTLGGITIMDENVPLSEAGVRNGSTLLLQHRHRRPVR
jgi:hypothetical protein